MTPKKMEETLEELNLVDDIMLKVNNLGNKSKKSKAR